MSVFFIFVRSMTASLTFYIYSRAFLPYFDNSRFTLWVLDHWNVLTVLFSILCKCSMYFCFSAGVLISPVSSACWHYQVLLHDPGLPVNTHGAEVPSHDCWGDKPTLWGMCILMTLAWLPCLSCWPPALWWDLLLAPACFTRLGCATQVSSLRCWWLQTQYAPSRRCCGNQVLDTSLCIVPLESLLKSNTWSLGGEHRVHLWN